MSSNGKKISELVETNVLEDDAFIPVVSGGETKKVRKSNLDQLFGLNDTMKAAILQLAEEVAYAHPTGQAVYTDLYNAFYPPATLVSIEAEFTQGEAVIYDNVSLETLLQYLEVTAHYDDNTSVLVTTYTLSGTLEPGTSTVTVSYDTMEDTFDVTVTAHPILDSISAVYTQSGTVYDTDTLDSLKTDLAVTAHYSDDSTQTVAAEDYTLSGTLEAGTSVIIVSYGGKTTTFSVTVEQLLPSGYTKLDYVETNGSQYINTNISETDAERAEYEVMVTSRPAGNGNHILSSQNVYFPFLRGIPDTSFGPQIGANNHGNDAGGDKYYAYELNKKYRLEGFPDVLVDGIYQFSLSRGSTESANNKLYLFTFGGSPTTTKYRFHGKLYSMKVFDSSDNIIGFFIPCRNPSNTVGLYDVVTASFLTSSGLTGGTDT